MKRLFPLSFAGYANLPESQLAASQAAKLAARNPLERPSAVSAGIGCPGNSWQLNLIAGCPEPGTRSDSRWRFDGVCLRVVSVGTLPAS